ncbi:hypothetical protein [Haloarchaeobius sp. DFWS5]|uniref:hypothetical protein n=1 Tax=Haloarchaeobius sp. DFWS5 TaxID=3446114 RepID=UPI003EBB29C2
MSLSLLALYVLSGELPATHAKAALSLAWLSTLCSGVRFVAGNGLFGLVALGLSVVAACGIFVALVDGFRRVEPADVL